MPRYNRINLDGKSVTEARVSAVAVSAGQLLAITGEKFVLPTAEVSQQLYVANTGCLQGLGAGEVVPAGDTVEGEYLETGREVAALVAAGVVCAKDTPLSVAATGFLTLPTDVTVGAGTVKSPIVAYAAEAITVSAGSPQLVRVRGA